MLGVNSVVKIVGSRLSDCLCACVCAASAERQYRGGSAATGPEADRGLAGRLPGHAGPTGTTCYTHGPP